MTRHRSGVRRSARYAGWSGFLAFELMVFMLARTLAEIRCCTASGSVRPQSSVEWGALMVFGVVMLLLGAATGVGLALGVEAMLRLIGGFNGRRGRTGR